MSSELNFSLQGTGVNPIDFVFSRPIGPFKDLSSTVDLTSLLNQQQKKNENKVTLPEPTDLIGPKPIVLLDKYTEGFNFLPSAASPTERAQDIIDEFLDKTNISRPGYTPVFEDKKPSSSQAPVRYTPKSEIESTSSEPASEPKYISKESVEDPFDKSFGFTSPSYTHRNRNTKRRATPTSAPRYNPRNKETSSTNWYDQKIKDLRSTSDSRPGYIPRNKKTETRSKRTKDPSYISKEYLKRSSRY